MRLMHQGLEWTNTGHQKDRPAQPRHETNVLLYLRYGADPCPAPPTTFNHP